MKASTTRLVVRAAPFVVAVAAFVVAMGAAFAQGEPAASSSATSTSPAEAAKPASVPSSAPSPSPAPRPVPPPPLIDDGTPRQATRGFLEAAGAGRFQEAARYLDVRGIQWGEQTPVEAAEQLGLLLQRRIWVDVESIDDTPEGDPSDGADAERIAAVEVDGHEIPITLTRISRSGGRRWVFSAATVARIPQLSRELGYDSWAMRIVPERHRESRLFGLWAWQWAGILVAALVAFPLGWLLAYLVVAVLKRATDRTAVSWDGRIVDGLNRVFRFGVGWLVMVLVILTLDMPPRLVNRWSPALSIPLILATGILIVQAIRGLTAVFLESVPDDQELNTRGLRTQLVFLRKIGSVAVGLVTLGIALMQFEVVRSVGWSLLASAGVAGVALGFAAQ
ncbi:MAG: mechanosensitive ion channel family protein, partial [Myxococcales bacterium]|nr:mechanosensitive ion channel family protein [Myxococcales bacterium]